MFDQKLWYQDFCIISFFYSDLIKKCVILVSEHFIYEYFKMHGLISFWLVCEEKNELLKFCRQKSTYGQACLYILFIIQIFTGFYVHGKI